MKADDEYSTCLPEIYKGDIECARGNIDQAKEIWNKIDKKNHKAQYELGERFNRVNDYEKVIECFNNSFATAKVPRDLSALYSLAFLYTKLKEYRKAIDMWQLIIDVLASDWNTTDGETVAWPKAEIEKLKTML